MWFKSSVSKLTHVKTQEVSIDTFRLVDMEHKQLYQ